MTALAAHPIRGSGSVCYEVHASWVSVLVWKPPMLSLVEGATASAARQIAVRVRSLLCHWRLLLQPVSEALKPSALLLLPFLGTLLLQRFLWFLLRLSPPVQTLAHRSLRGAQRPPCALPCQRATPMDHSPHEGPTEDRVFNRKASAAAGKRVVSARLVIFRLVCLARDAPQRSPRASLSPRKLDEPRWQVPACSSCLSIHLPLL